MRGTWRVLAGGVLAGLAAGALFVTSVQAQTLAAVGRPMSGFGLSMLPQAMALATRIEAVEAATASARTCVVADPTPTPLNVRATPRGDILANLNDGVEVSVLETATANNGKLWARIETAVSSGVDIRGWVFLDYLYC